MDKDVDATTLPNYLADGCVNGILRKYVQFDGP
jgi:hypothetical protein